MEKTLKEHLYVLILCGGGGKRLWPRSRKRTPKQFIPLLGKKTIFQETVERAVRLTSAGKIFVVTNYDYVDEVLQQGKMIPPRNIIAEPEPKNTALAIGVGTIYIQKQDSQAVVINLASDHLISPQDKFLKEMIIAAQMAFLGDYLITVGIKPNFPHTGLGYIKTGQEFKKIRNTSIYNVLGFTEKPSVFEARQFLKRGKYFWNANLYTWSVSSVRTAFELHASKIADLLTRVEKSIGTKNEAEVLRKVYRQAEDISVDYAISEKVKNLLLVPASFSWSDVGNWEVVYNLSEKDRDGNAVVQYAKEGKCMGLETKNCLIETGSRLVATIGISDLIIVDTKDALLVCPHDKVEEVKTLVNKLKEKGKEEYL